MRALPKGVYAHKGGFRAGISVGGKTQVGPTRHAVSAALQDLRALREGRLPERKEGRALPKFVYRHIGLRKGYRACRQISKVLVAGPLRASVHQAAADAAEFAAAKTLAALKRIKAGLPSRGSSAP